MKISESPDFLESIANDPRVLKFVSPDGTPVSFGDKWADCIGLEWETGGFVFHRHDPETYEVHTLFLPRTPDTNGKAQEALGYVFGLGATTILTQVAKDLPHVRRFALRHGFLKFGEGEGRDYFELLRKDSQECQQQS